MRDLPIGRGLRDVNLEGIWFLDGLLGRGGGLNGFA